MKKQHYLYKSTLPNGLELEQITVPFGVIGMVYEGQDKFFGKEVIGVLIEMFDQNDEAILRTKEGKLTSVDKNSLKLVA
jgi:gamma-glutamyl phosphate reductase